MLESFIAKMLAALPLLLRDPSTLRHDILQTRMRF